MKLIDFTHNYPDEESCKAKFRELREREGIVCPICGCKEHYWKRDKECFECKKCHHRTGLKSGTVMHKSKLPFQYWFFAIHLLTSTKKSFSAKEIQRQLSHKRYQPIWHMLHKLRTCMGTRDGLYKLTSEVELDGAFFSTETPVEEKDKPIKRGRGSQRKTKVIVMTESQIPDKESKNAKPKKVRYIKMIVIPDLKAETITPVAQDSLSSSITVISDDDTSFAQIKDVVKEHKPQVVKPKDIGKVLPWVHIAISNAKRLFLDMYHDIKPEYLQLYLNEFCYKFNRRYYGLSMFDHLLIACISSKNEFRYT
jgi:hypothetical protein